ncbi:hypothetical protein BK133_10905 [Paenibacillus sp. FSL H8-0548]|uniref:hypothetical protein n=1 Tax=Paenibacillus sp. FSL H8-0548 TaxID=1920422 RepID=UPI00096DB74E|nr:hypothetical protein [Paenibacillus sp. FSL H8-0548]OMF35213.1 hypothetical protein BK133_10905 [Paenibacillus sp. FSL H8-0548]
MIAISERLESILKVIPFGEGVKYGEILSRLEIKNGYLIGSLQWLVEKGLVNKEGVTRQYRYSRTEIEFVVVSDREHKDAAQDPDEIANHLKSMRPTAEQRQFLNKHKHLPRRELASRLGLTKLEINHVLLQMGIGKK